MAQKLSADFLKKVEKSLKAEQADIKKRIFELEKDDPFADPDHVSDNAAVDTDVREQVGHDTIEAEIKDLQKKLIDIELALKKIAKGNYGICERCGRSIPPGRLKILPEARYCIDCEQKLRK